MEPAVAPVCGIAMPKDELPACLQKADTLAEGVDSLHVNNSMHLTFPHNSPQPLVDAADGSLDLLDLSDSTLATILCQLTSSADVAALRLTCKRWRDVTHAWLQSLGPMVDGLSPAVQNWPLLTSLVVRVHIGPNNLSCHAPLYKVPLQLLWECRHLQRLKLWGYRDRVRGRYYDQPWSPSVVNSTATKDPLDVQDLVGCTQLTSLEFCVIDVVGLRHLSSLVHLQKLVLSRVKTADFGGISSLISLRQLDIKDSHIEHIQFVAPCIHLTRLSVSSCNEVRDVTPLCGLTNLLQLDLSNTPVVDVSPAANCSNLEVLDITNTRVSQVHCLAACSSLRSLCMQHTQVTDFDALGYLTALTELNMSYTPIQDVSVLRNCSKLEILDLSHTMVTQVGLLAAWTNLRRLSLQATRVASLSFLQVCHMLEVLDLQMSHYVSDLTPLASCQNLRELTFGSNRVTNISALAACTALTSLELCGKHVRVVNALAACTSLTSLNLWSTRVSDVNALAACTSLTSLKLPTSVRDVSALVACTALRSLTVSSNSIADVSVLQTANPRLVVHVP